MPNRVFTSERRDLASLAAAGVSASADVARAQASAPLPPVIHDGYNERTETPVPDED